jgi:hypothetical protein
MAGQYPPIPVDEVFRSGSTEHSTQVVPAQGRRTMVWCMFRMGKTCAMAPHGLSFLCTAMLHDKVPWPISAAVPWTTQEQAVDVMLLAAIHSLKCG